MAENAKLKIKEATAQEICGRYALAESAKPYLAEGMAPLDFLAALTAAADYADAVQFLARALPKREAVWWACLCSRETPAGEGEAACAAAIEAAESWVRRPSEEHRRKAQQASEPAGAHPARWAATGAFWSGGSIAPPDAPEVKPPEDLTARAVAGAVMMAAAAEPKQIDLRYRRFLDYGTDIAKGGNGRPAAGG